MTSKNFSVSEKLLLAAFELEKDRRQPFSAEDLVVKAWQKFPDAFGLAGYYNDDGHPLYPDSNRVFAEIMGSKPIRKRGLLTKVGKKMYQLTASGREHAQLLLNREVSSPLKKTSLSREIRKEIQRLLSTKAVEKYKNNRHKDLTFSDACSFWRISPRSSAIEFKGRTANLVSILKVTHDSIQNTDVAFKHGGQTFGTNELNILQKVHDTLLERFKREIEIIQKRTDERA